MHPLSESNKIYHLARINKYCQGTSKNRGVGPVRYRGIVGAWPSNTSVLPITGTHPRGNVHFHLSGVSTFISGRFVPRYEVKHGGWPGALQGDYRQVSLECVYPPDYRN